MIRPDRDIVAVYLHRKPVDMRKQMDGLAAVVAASQSKRSLHATRPPRNR